MRFTRVQVSPAPVTLLTVVLLPLRYSVEMKASTCSLAADVVNTGLVMVVLADSVFETVTSAAIAPNAKPVASAKKPMRRTIEQTTECLLFALRRNP